MRAMFSGGMKAVALGELGAHRLGQGRADQRLAASR